MSMAAPASRIPWAELSPIGKREAVRPLAEAGLTYAQMAERLSALHGPVRVPQVAGVCQYHSIPVAREARGCSVTPAEQARWRGLSPQQKTDLLRPLVARGLSAAQAAGELLPLCGPVSRASVIAHCHRAGLQLAGGVVAAQLEAARGAARRADNGRGARPVSGDPANRQRPDPASLPTLSALLARTAHSQSHSASHAERAGMTAEERRALALASCRPRGPVGLHALNAQTCRWPLTADDGSTVYCGESRAHGAFCKGHGALAYCPAPADKARLKAAARKAGERETGSAKA